MNTKSLIAAAALAFVGSVAVADEVQSYPTPSTLTRAAVIAELNRAVAAGEVTTHAETYGAELPNVLAARQADNSATRLSRVEIRRQLANVQGEYSATLLGEAYGTVQPGLSLRSREVVRAEAIAAARSRVPGAQYNGG